jgi:hypothetical protein
MKTINEFSIPLGRIFFQTCLLIGGLLCLLYPFVKASQGSDINQTPEQIKSSLLNEDYTHEANLPNLVKALNLVIPKEAINGAITDVACNEFDYVELNRVGLLRPVLQAVLIASSASCGYTYLVVLEQTNPNGWRLVRTIPFWSKYNRPRISFESLISQDEKEIIVQNYETYAGTGIFQKHMTIWKLFQDGLRVVLDEPTIVTFSIPIKGGRNTDQEESSEFNFVMDPEVTEGLKQIIQKQMIRDHKTQITRWWLYLYEAELGRFRKEPTLR